MGFASLATHEGEGVRRFDIAPEHDFSCYLQVVRCGRHAHRSEVHPAAHPFRHETRFRLRLRQDVQKVAHVLQARLSLQ